MARKGEMLAAEVDKPKRERRGRVAKLTALEIENTRLEEQRGPELEKLSRVPAGRCICYRNSVTRHR